MVQGRDCSRILHESWSGKLWSEGENLRLTALWRPCLAISRVAWRGIFIWWREKVQDSSRLPFEPCLSALL